MSSLSPFIWLPLLLLLLSCTASCEERLPVYEVYEKEYRLLHAQTEDKDGLESIRALHQQLDNDNDGTIEPSETGNFISGDLQYRGNDQQQLRQKRFHGRDTEITVKDLWDNWWRSEVHNWTVEQTVDWLTNNVQLPQYVDTFRSLKLTGANLPKVATDAAFLTKVIGVTNPIHRSKITLKAMDVVLFGPPRDPSSPLKDIILTSLLMLAVSGLFYAYRQNKKSQEHLKKMISDMEGLSKAEETLKDLQEKLQLRDTTKNLDLASAGGPVTSDASDLVASSIEVSRLKEEVEVLRHELQRAEIELEDRCWLAPPVLQHWLQLTYELESQIYNAKKKAAERQLEMAKDMCEKLKRKRSSLVGAFVSTHGRSIDDVDRSILDAKTALMEVTQDLKERSLRWRQIEVLCGCSIVVNPGLTVIKKLVRHVGAGRGSDDIMSKASGKSNAGSASVDDLEDINHDTQSISGLSSKLTSSTPSNCRKAFKSVVMKQTSGESFSLSSATAQPAFSSSSSSTSSDEVQVENSSSSYSCLSSCPPVATNQATAPAPKPPSSAPLKCVSSSKVGSSGRILVKSFSQDEASGQMPSSSSCVFPAALSERSLHQSCMPLSSTESALSIMGSAVLQERCASDDAMSVASDVSHASKKSHKKLFFNFRRKKQKDIL